MINSYIEENQQMLVSLLKELCRIPAPSHHEEKRAEFCKRWLKEQGAEGVFIDEAWNVIYPYRCRENEPVAIFMAHIDTVFPDMEPMEVYENDGKLYAPGVGDDTANVAILLMIARYLILYQPETTCGIVIAANSCEEGLGNLKGSKMLMERYGSVAEQVISFDGYMNEICNCAVGSMRYRIEIRTEGGHSYFDFGNRNAIECAARLIEVLYQYQVPEDGSKTTYNVGVVRGGTSVNSIAEQAELLYEFRSDNFSSMEQVNVYFENVILRFKNMGADIQVELIGERPCGRKDNQNPKQKRLEEFCKNTVERVTGRAPGYTAASTDCNVPFLLGIPAAPMGLCLGNKAHTRGEWIYLSSLKQGFKIAAEIMLDKVVNE